MEGLVRTLAVAVMKHASWLRILVTAIQINVDDIQPVKEQAVNNNNIEINLTNLEFFKNIL